MTAQARVEVWDVAVRICHWSLVVLFLAAYLSGDDDSLLHVYAGYGVLGLVAFRLVWGFVGTKHARFSDFIRGRAATADYLRSLRSSKPQHHLGHNPLAGWMIVALLACLAASCWSGLLAYGAQGHGPLAGGEVRFVPVATAHAERSEHQGDRRGSEGAGNGDEFWDEIHEALSNLTLSLVFLHVAGALVSSAIHRENLIKAMVTGYKTRR